MQQMENLDSQDQFYLPFKNMDLPNNEFFQEEYEESDGDSTSLVGYAYDPIMLLHSKESATENKYRIQAINYWLLKTKLKEKLKLLKCPQITPEFARLVHSKEYINYLLQIPEKFKVYENQCQIEQKKIFDDDCYETEFLKDVAFASCGALIEAVEQISSGSINYAFCNIRPPGHHATGHPNYEGAGFCFLNNVAIATKYALKYKNKQIKKIAIVDWDVHHGDGTQKQFYEDNQVLFVSLHRYDNGTYYPGETRSHFTFIGDNKGKGYNINIPFNSYLEKCQNSKNFRSKIGDEEYIFYFKNIIIPILTEFAPDLIFISAGFDAALGDQLGQFSITPVGYAYMTNALKKICSKLIFALEGGYFKIPLCKSIEAVLRVLLFDQFPIEECINKKNCFAEMELNNNPEMIFVQKFYLGLLKVLSPYWTSLLPAYKSNLNKIEKLDPQLFIAPEGKGRQITYF